MIVLICFIYLILLYCDGFKVMKSVVFMFDNKISEINHQITPHTQADLISVHSRS